MANSIPLHALNKSSARVAKFAVRPWKGRVESYTFISKRNGQEVTAHKFECWLIGNNAKEYCIGFVKGTEAQCKVAQGKFSEDTVFSLSKVVLDSYAQATYISTPIQFRVDLGKSTMTPWDDKELIASHPKHPVPPRTVADVAVISTNRMTDLIAMVKEVSPTSRRTRSEEEVVDIELLDNSTTKADKLATIMVSVIGTGKVEVLRASLGKPMAFFNLSIVCQGRGSTPQITHFARELMLDAPDCDKTTSLRDSQEELFGATNTEQLSAVWTPQSTKDVSGPQSLSCAAFLDFTTDIPDAAFPEVVQIMWVHIEEPEPDEEILDPSGTHIWYRAALRDASGSVTLGIPARSAFELAGCRTQQEFVKKHKERDLNMPLLSHVRVSRSVVTKEGTSESRRFVNHTVEKVEAVSWATESAPNAAYTDVLAILNNCPEHDQGMSFAFLGDIQPDPHYGMRVVYDGQDGPKGLYVGALVASYEKSKAVRLGEDGYMVTTADVKDIANPAGTLEDPIGNHTLVGYCSMDRLTGFQLDPPRAKSCRVAFVLFTKADETEGLHIHKLEYVEPSQVNDAIQCMRKLRTLSKKVHTKSKEKRSHSVALEHEGLSPMGTKKARTLQATPTDSSLPGDRGGA